MSSQFDDLLGDLDDSTNTSSITTTTTVKSTSNGAVDDFDPFGPSSTDAQFGDSNLLMDFSVTTSTSQVENGNTSNGVGDFGFHQDSSQSPFSSDNPMYTMDADTSPSANPLYDFASSGSGNNPLYDFDLTTTTTTTTTTSSTAEEEHDANSSANPLYDFSTEGSGSFASTNPLYELDNPGDGGGPQGEAAPAAGIGLQQDEDFLAGDAHDDRSHMLDGADQGQYEDVPEDEDEEGGVEVTNTTTTTTTAAAAAGVEQFYGDQDYYEQQEAATSGYEGDIVTVTEDVVQQSAVLDDQELTSASELPAQIEDEPREEQGGDMQLPDLVVLEEGDEDQGKDRSEVRQEEEEQGDLCNVGDQSVRDQPTPEPMEEKYDADRREVDLEQYCVDRDEDSDLVMDEPARDNAMGLQHPPALEETPELAFGDDEAAVAAMAPTCCDDSCSPMEDEVMVDQEDVAIQEAQSAQEVIPPAQSYEERETEEAEGVKVPPPEEDPDGRTVTTITTTTTTYGEDSRYPDSDIGSAGMTSQEYSSNQWDQSGGNTTSGQPDIIQFSEMSSMKNRFESEPTPAPRRPVDVQQEVLSAEGGVYESEPQTFQQWQNEEEEEEGIHENEPERRDDVARESDRDISAELPSVGTASNLRAKFLSSNQEASSPRTKREITPPAHGAGGEYVSEPRSVVEKYQGTADAGVFESQPQANPEVITSNSQLEEALPEHGFAKNVAARFREMEAAQGSAVSNRGSKREITPDRSGQVEYVSEPRGQVEHYAGKAESGVFESQPLSNPEVVKSGEELPEDLPERGLAKNMAQKFRQISIDNAAPVSAGRAKREITPDTSGRVEYVSEPRTKGETYEARVDAGVFENQPQEDPDVVKSDSLAEDYVPQRGFARNVAAKFREMESTTKSPPLSPGRRKEFTPPREDAGQGHSGVFESTPEVKQEVVHAGDQLEEALPQRGTAKNMALRFREMESENRSPSGQRPKKEFTPPPHESGVFENQPKTFQAEYNRPAESGIMENQPVQRDDLVRESEPPKFEEELPERGMARNLVSRWRQMESNSAKATSPGSGGRPKEFTPPREEPRIAQQRKSPRTPLSPTAYGGQMDNGSVHPTDLPGQYQPQHEAYVFESQPERLPDVVREEDTDWQEGMPKKDTAKKMLAKFKKIQSEVKEDTSPRKASESESSESEPAMENSRLKFEDPDQVGRSKSMRAAILTEKCGACDKTVYAMERMEMNKRVYHKACFRCTQCKAVLTPKTFAINNDVIFCTSHYKQLFATKGNYDEGFGRMQHKKRWNSNPNLTEVDGDKKSNS